MSGSAAQRLIIVLTAVVAILALIFVALRLLPTTGIVPETAEVPTRAVAALTPTLAATTAPTASATPSPTETPVIQVTTPPLTPTVTAVPTVAAINHTVQTGETLSSIAGQYSVTLDALTAANNLANPDAIAAGQVLTIPVNQPASQPIAEPTTQPSNPPTTQPTNPPTPPASWPPSQSGDGAAENYPLSMIVPSGQITLHYQPGTYPDQHIESLSQTIDDIWADVQTRLGEPLPRAINVYLAGTLFAVNPLLQGLTQSLKYRSFILVNGAFHPGEEQYIIAHELTHIASTHVLGATNNLMLHEGLAVYLPQAYLTEQAGYLPHTEICAALVGTPEFRTAVRMQDFSYGPSGFGGHIRNYFNYNLAGCFVTYLIETYGLEKLDWVYETGDYEGIYGRSLAQLDQEWQVWLTAVPLTVDSQQLIATINQVITAYVAYGEASAGGVHANWDAYLHLNRARLYANQGRFAEAEFELNTFYTLLVP
jgi:LysM repeat protein